MFHRLAKVVAMVAVMEIVMAVFPLKSTKIVCPVRSPHRVGTTVFPPVTVIVSVTQLPSPSGCASMKSRKSIRSCVFYFLLNKRQQNNKLLYAPTNNTYLLIFIEKVLNRISRFQLKYISRTPFEFRIFSI